MASSPKPSSSRFTSTDVSSTPVLSSQPPSTTSPLLSESPTQGSSLTSDLPSLPATGFSDLLSESSTQQSSPTSGISSLPTISNSLDSTSTQPLRVSMSDSAVSYGLSGSLPLNPPPIGSIVLSNVLTSTYTRPYAKTGTPVGSTTRGFFGNRAAAAGTFAGLGVGFVIILFMAFLCRRRYRRRNEQRKAQARDTRISRPQIRKVSFVDDLFARSDLGNSATVVESHRRWNSAHDKRALGHPESGFMTQELTKQRTDGEKGIFYDPRHPRLAGISPRFVVGHRSDNQGGLQDRQVSQPPPHNRGLLTVDHPPAITQFRPHPVPFPDMRRVSQTPSSPSIYPPTLAMVDDDVSFWQHPNPTSIAYQKRTTFLNQSHNRGAKRSLRRVPVKPEAYTVPPDSGGGQGSLNVVRREPPCDGDRRPAPPPIPPKSHLRAAVPTQMMHTQRL